MENPANTLLEVSTSYVVPRCLHVVADLGVADALDDRPRTAAELATSIGANADALGRSLRLLSAYGIFEGQDGKFAHTPASRLLRSDHPQSMRAYVRMIGFPVYWRSFELLNHSIATGNPAMKQIAPKGAWEYLAKHPELNKIFDEAMTGKAHGQIAGILASYDFSSFKTIADIGGGQGHLLQAILDATPNATGVLFDQPHVVGNVAASSRLTLQGGDFFTDPLPVCDAYLIMNVIHDWSDREAIAILSAIRRAAQTHAKLVLIEFILPEDDKPGWVKMVDIIMMTILTGRERTCRQYDAMLSTSGFRLDRVIEIGLGTSILEASVL